VFGCDYLTTDGSAIRDYIHVNDLATAHVAALNYLLDGGGQLSLNLGTGAGASVLDVIEIVKRTSGRPIKIRQLPRRAGDPGKLLANAFNAKRILGWSPLRSGIDVIIADAWQWHSSRFRDV
jgi:UDP-glucose 4-epimerase